jgi:urease accessory protein
MRYAPALHVTRSAVTPTGSGPYDWMVHRRALPVVFLTCPLLGLSDPDELAVDVALDRDVAAVVATQGPTTLLRTDAAVRMRHRFRLEPGAHLTYLPWLTIPFPGSRAVIEHDVELAAGASFVAWDSMAVGRVAREERFAFDELHVRWRLRRDGALLLDDRLRLAGADPVLASAAFGGHTHLASVLIAGRAEEALPLGAVRELLAGLPLAGASRPVPDVLVVRALADGAEHLEQALWPVVALADAAAGAPALAPGDVARRWLRHAGGPAGPPVHVRTAQPVLG